MAAPKAKATGKGTGRRRRSSPKIPFFELGIGAFAWVSFMSKPPEFLKEQAKNYKVPIAVVAAACAFAYLKWGKPTPKHYPYIIVFLVLGFVAYFRKEKDMAIQNVMGVETDMLGKTGAETRGPQSVSSTLDSFTGG